MLRATTKFWLIPALLLWGGTSVFGFALAGPIGNGGDGWQSPTLGYGLFPPNFGTDAVAPKNLGEQYRWNTKNVYYAFDTSFLDYFGTNGAAQVDAAFAILNNLSNVDAYSPSLSEWPLTSSRINFSAAQVDMFDLKSEVLIEMMEQLGLAEPDRYTFALHARVPIAGLPCPNFEYFITERNFDPVTQNYSPYVNGVLYAFEIIEECAAVPVNPEAPVLADAVNFPVDPEQTADGLTAVAAGLFGGIPNPSNPDPSTLGRSYLNLTRDDVGGFRYLLSTNTIVTESVEPESLLQQPATQPTLIVTSNLAVLEAALTNTPAALQAIFPTLQITSSTFLYYSNVVATNFITVTNPAPPGSPPGTPPSVVQVPVLITNLLPIFGFTFGNVLTNFTYTNGGVLVTNSPGEYILVPANQCGFSILSNALTTVVSQTNTNSPVITLFTNHTLVVDVFTCVANSVALREGMEKMNFFRVDFDSLVGQTWGPVTNTYSLTAVTNSKPFVQTFFRTVVQPDILFSAEDFAGGPASLPVSLSFVRTSPSFNQANIPAGSGLAGPGTIVPAPIHITFNKSGPIFIQETGTFLTPIGGVGNTNIPEFQWASFDGTTNAPFVYPGNNNYQNLVNSIFLQMTVPGSLPNGNTNQSYSFLLQASGATPPPYTYTVVANSGSLPNGLNLTTASGNTFISGTPTAAGIFDFTLQVADSAGRATQRNFSLEIDP